MEQKIDRTRLKMLLDSFATRRVGVIGDFTMDGYWHADMTRSQLSRETPLFPRPVVRESYSPGGAANVAWNLADLRPEDVFAFTVFGEDWRGELFRKVLTQAHIRLEDVITQKGWNTPFYGKVILMGDNSKQEDARLDFINTEPIQEETEQALIEKVKNRLPELDALIVADYQMVGVVTPAVTKALNQLALEFPDILFVVDSRDRVGNFHSMVIKPNNIEAARFFFPDQIPGLVSEEDLNTVGSRLARENHRPAFITLGHDGCMVYDQDTVNHVSAIQVLPPIDTVGAGDTFIASLTAGLVCNATPVEAANLAALSAAITIKKLGVTGTASPEEILTQFDAIN
jgi:rfaE bifunctional protein kinase chain/domain